MQICMLRMVVPKIFFILYLGCGSSSLNWAFLASKSEEFSATHLCVYLFTMSVHHCLEASHAGVQSCLIMVKEVYVIHVQGPPGGLWLQKCEGSVFSMASRYNHMLRIVNCPRFA